MSKTIIYPTDFSVESLEPLKAYLQFQTQEKKEIILVHAVHLTDSITDLLFFNKMELIKNLSSEEFDTKLKEMKSELGEYISTVRIELFTGFTQAAFDTFCEALKVDKIVMASTFKFNWKNKKSLNILPYLNRSNLVKANVSSNEQSFTSFTSNKIITQQI